MTAVTSFCGLCLLLIIGKFLRMRFSLFQRRYLPSSVIAGVVGLCVVFFGGIWTSLAVPLLLTQGFPVVLTVSVCMIVLWLLFWRFVLRPSKNYI